MVQKRKAEGRKQQDAGKKSKKGKKKRDEPEVFVNRRKNKSNDEELVEARAKVMVKSENAEMDAQPHQHESDGENEVAEKEEVGDEEAGEELTASAEKEMNQLDEEFKTSIEQQDDNEEIARKEQEMGNDQQEKLEMKVEKEITTGQQIGEAADSQDAVLSQHEHGEEEQKGGPDLEVACENALDREALEQAELEEKLVFHRIKELNSLRPMLDDSVLEPNLPTDREKSPIEVALESVLGLRTSRAEVLLDNCKQVYKERHIAQMDLVKRLSEELSLAKSKLESVDKTKDSLLNEISQLRAKNVELSAEVAKSLGDKLVSKSEGSEKKISGAKLDDESEKVGEVKAELDQMRQKLHLYSKLTGLTIKIAEEGVVTCTLKDAVKKIVTQYIFEAQETEGELMFSPKANQHLLPEKCRDPIIVKESQLPYLQALLQGTFFNVSADGESTKENLPERPKTKKEKVVGESSRMGFAASTTKI